MKQYSPSLPSDLPDLPLGCNEIQATGKTDAELPVGEYIDRLPGLDAERHARLRQLATPARDLSGERPAEESTALDVADLLRYRADGSHALHPRVTHVIPLAALSQLLDAVCTLLDEDPYWNAYQYPAYVLECRGGDPDTRALYPPAYHVRIADIARDLRANDIVTAIRCPGQTCPARETLRTTVESMQADGTTVHGATILHQPADERDPTLSLLDEDYTRTPPSHEELKEHCQSLCYRHGMMLDMATLPQEGE